MILVIEPHNVSEHSHLIDEMFRLRARVFHDHLRWDVQVADGKERDKYDDEGPVYLIHADGEKQKVKGSLRLLPTTGPTVLADFFSDTLPSAAHLSAPSIWECTCFCLDDTMISSNGCRNEQYFDSAVLIAALGDVAIKAGIESILGNFDLAMLRLYRRIGCEVDILGSTQRYGQSIYLGLFSISDAILHKVKRRLEKAQSVMEGAPQRRSLVA